MKSDCEIVRDLLPLYKDNTASGASVQMIEEHLPRCPGCASFLKDIGKEMPSFSNVQDKSRETTEYVSLAKRINRTKWYWRLAIGILVFCVIWISAMYAEGYRFSPEQAAYAGNIIDRSNLPLTSLKIGDKRMMYIFLDDGFYREIHVSYRFPFWRHQYTTPDHYIRQDEEAPLQIVSRRGIANSLDKSYYIVYAVVANDDRVAYVELGKEGKMQKHKVDNRMVAFYWDETGNWDESNNWSGGIKLSELRGMAYAADGTPLYELRYEENEHVWMETE